MMQRLYESRHGRWKDKIECKRLQSLGEGADVEKYGSLSKSGSISVEGVLMKDEFDLAMSNMRSKAVLEVRFAFKLS